jgi:hypothetical protein
MSYNIPTRTAADVAAAVKRVFGDESGVQLVDNDIITWVNQAQVHIASSTRVLKTKATTVIVNGQSTYTLSGLNPNILQMESILIDGRRIGNMSTAQAEESISRIDPLAEETGFPRFWYEWAGEITFWPKPDFDGQMVIRYTALPATVVNISDVMSVPDEFFNDVTNFVLQKAYEMDENVQMMMLAKKDFDESMSELTDEERQAQNMTYETLTIYNNFF